MSVEVIQDRILFINDFLFNPKCNTPLVIACHLDSIVKARGLINNIVFFINSGIQLIYLICSKGCKYNYVLKHIEESGIIIEEVENTLLADFGKFRYFLNTFEYKKYKNIIYTNDSIILTGCIKDFINSAGSHDLYGFNDSSDVRYHYHSFLFSVKDNTKLLDFINKSKDNIHSFQDVIDNYELRLGDVFHDKDCYMHIAEKADGLNLYINADDIYVPLLEVNKVPIIKIKRIVNHVILEKLTNLNIIIYTGPTNSIIYVLYYDEATKIEAEKIYGKYNWFKPIFNETSKYVESGFILDVLPKLQDEWKDKDYVGTISWKAYKKIKITDFEKINIARDQDLDLVYLLYTENCFENMFKNIDYLHPLFSKIWASVLEKMGYCDVFPQNVTWFYCNYWLAKPSVMKQYIEFGKRARDIMESIPEIKDLCERNSMYELTPPDPYKVVTGKKYYMYHPFIMERLPCFFAYMNKLKIRHYKRLDNFPNIHPIVSSSNRLIVYTYTGKEQRLRKFVNSKHSSDCYYVFNSVPPSDISVSHSITRDRKGIFEGWSDVILNIPKDKYEYFIFVTDVDNIDILGVDNWDDILISQITNDNHFVQLDNSNFIVDKVGLETIDGIVFHPIIEVNDDKFAMSKTRKAIATAGYYQEQVISSQLFIPHNIFTGENFKVSDPFLELSQYSTDIAGYFYIHKNGGIYSNPALLETGLKQIDSHYDIIIGVKDKIITNEFIASKSHTDFSNFLLVVILKIIGLRKPLPVEYLAGNGIFSLYTAWYINRGTIDKTYVSSIYGVDIFENIYTSFSSKVGLLSF
jgi:hypothetical protein